MCLEDIQQQRIWRRRRASEKQQPVWESAVWTLDLCGMNGDRTGESNNVPEILSWLNLLHTRNVYGFMKLESLIQREKCFCDIIMPLGDCSGAAGHAHIYRSLWEGGTRGIKAGSAWEQLEKHGILALPAASWMTLGKSPNLTELQGPSRKSVDVAHVKQFVVQIKGNMYITYSKHSVNARQYCNLQCRDLNLNNIKSATQNRESSKTQSESLHFISLKNVLWIYLYLHYSY